MVGVLKGGMFKFLVYVAIGAGLIGAYSQLNPQAFVVVPSTRDSRLEGDWYGQRHGYYNHYRLDDDGKGKLWTTGRDPRDLRWGTDSGTLRMRYEHSNGWRAPEFQFSLSNDGQTLYLKTEFDANPIEMKRTPPQRAWLE